MEIKFKNSGVAIVTMPLLKGAETYYFHGRRVVGEFVVFYRTMTATFPDEIDTGVDLSWS